jgi:nucleotide-binding universal stress UspA family protein
MAPTDLKIKRILSPTDFSEPSTRAFERAVDLAASFEAQITALHVVVRCPYPVPADPGLPYIPLPTEAGRIEREEAAKALGTFVRPFTQKGVRIETMLREGNPTREIPAAAEALAADIVVMGSHGRSGFERLLLGSVTEKTMRRVRCPVLTVGNTPREAIVRPGFRRILCPVDLLGSYSRTAHMALALAEKNGAELTLLNVIEDLRDEAWGANAYRAFPEIATSDEERLEQAKGLLRCAVRETARDRVRIEDEVRVGSAGQEILRIAAESRADLIVMGAYSSSPIARLFFGSTSRHVLRHAACPVLIVREEEDLESSRRASERGGAMIAPAAGAWPG